MSKSTRPSLDLSFDRTMKTSALVLLSLTSVIAQNDPCKTTHTDQASCDADKKTGGGCTWCKCGALPSACWTIADSKKLPPGMFKKLVP